MRRRKGSGSAASTLVTTSLSAALDLAAAKSFVSKLRESVQGVDRYDDLTHHDVVLQDRVCGNGLDDGARVGKPARFQHDAVNSRRRGVPSHPIVADLTEQRHETRTLLAAGAAARKNTQAHRAEPAGRHPPARRRLR